jgi:transcription initiation factor TFIIH subunit 2
MGFPKRTFDSTATFGYDGNSVKIFSSSYICSRCHARTSEIPAQCNVCFVQLNSSSHIARSHHHLFPVSNFNELRLFLNSNNKLIGKIINNNNNLEYFEDDHDEEKNIINVPSSGSVEVRNDSNNNNNSKESNLNIVSKHIYPNDDESTHLIVSCKACLEKFTIDSTPFQCPDCLNIFCVECDLFIHDSLHNCPGC